MRDFSTQIDQLTEQLFVAGQTLANSLSDPDAVQSAPIHHRAAAAAVVVRFLDLLSRRIAQPMDGSNSRFGWDFGAEEPEQENASAGSTDQSVASAAPAPAAAPEPQLASAAPSPYSSPSPAPSDRHGLRPGIPHAQVQPHVKRTAVPYDPVIHPHSHAEHLRMQDALRGSKT